MWHIVETVATDTFCSDTPAADDGIAGHGGCAMVQFYVGTKSLLKEVFPMKRVSQMAGTLFDFNRHRHYPLIISRVYLKKWDNARCLSSLIYAEARGYFWTNT